MLKIKDAICLISLTFAWVQADAKPCYDKSDPNIKPLEQIVRKIRGETDPRSLVPLYREVPWVMVPKRDKDYFDRTGKLP